MLKWREFGIKIRSIQASPYREGGPLPFLDCLPSLYTHCRDSIIPR